MCQNFRHNVSCSCNPRKCFPSFGVMFVTYRTVIGRGQLAGYPREQFADEHDTYLKTETERHVNTWSALVNLIHAIGDEKSRREKVSSSSGRLGCAVTMRPRHSPFTLLAYLLSFLSVKLTIPINWGRITRLVIQ